MKIAMKEERQGIGSCQTLGNVSIESASKENLRPVKSRVEMDPQSTGRMRQAMAHLSVVDCEIPCEPMGQSSGVSMPIANISPVYHQSVLNSRPPLAQPYPSSGYGPEATMRNMSCMSNTPPSSILHCSSTDYEPPATMNGTTLCHQTLIKPTVQKLLIREYYVWHALHEQQWQSAPDRANF